MFGKARKLKAELVEARECIDGWAKDYERVMHTCAALQSDIIKKDAKLNTLWDYLKRFQKNGDLYCYTQIPGENGIQRHPLRAAVGLHRARRLEAIINDLRKLIGLDPL